jgi:hypothetical protein
VSHGTRSASLYDEEDLHGMYDAEKAQGGTAGISGLVTVGAAPLATAAPPKDNHELMEGMVQALHARFGWDRKQIEEITGTGFHPQAPGHQAERAHLQQVHANPKLHHVALHGFWSGFNKFASQFDPTWPKAKFGGAVRSALCAAGSLVGIPVGPILDQCAGLAQKMPWNQHQAPGPMPPVVHNAPPLPPVSPGYYEPHYHRGMSKGAKIALGVGAVVGVGGILYALTKRKTNPRRRRNARRRRR